MATLLSSPTSMIVSAPSASSLGALASSMAHGTWAQFAATNQDAVIGSQPGNSGSLINYSTYFPWNPVAKCIEFVGSDHAGAAPGGKLPSSYARYNDATNAFSMAAVDDLIAPGGQVTAVHGGGHSQVDPFTGDLYHHKAFGSTSQFDLWKCALGSSTFTRLGTTPSAYCQVLLGSCWWSGSYSGTRLGPRGAYMLYNSGACFNKATDGEIFVYDPTAGFKATITGATPFAVSSNGPVMAYSPTHNCALYGGGDLTAHKAFRLNPDGSHTNMPNVPSAGMGIGIGAIACDPVTGKFLLLSNGQLWELNPVGAGTWTLQTGLRTPPPGVRNPTQMGQGMALTSIPEYGVIAAISQIAGSGGTFFLYKHA